MWGHFAQIQALNTDMQTTNPTKHTNSATLLITCPDKKGIVAAIANFLMQHNGNILHADQHQDAENGLFLMRIEWSREDFDLKVSEFDSAFSPVAQTFDMQWQLKESQRKTKMAIMVSQYDHCLVDLLHRHHHGELACEIPLIISNHETCKALADYYGIAFHYLPMTKETKAEVEAQQFKLFESHGIDLIVLARYMQILSPDFVSRYSQQIINIHHSFLPAFIGAKPYHRAFERGVKLIGATAHYVTKDLDEGPIIEQDIARISHRDQVEHLIQKGRDLERLVLSNAVKWHIDHRILLYANKTVIFD